MSKLERMRQESIEQLLRWCIDHEPGVTSLRLFEYTKEWYGKVWSSASTADFERALGALHTSGYRCTNKQWYPKGHTAEPKRRGPAKEDPRQTRMFG